MIQNVKTALIVRTIFTLYAVIGLFIHLDIFTLNLNLKDLLYYTNQSNIIVVGFMIFLLVKTILSFKNKENKVSFYPRLQMVMTIGIMVTFIVYWALLAPVANYNLITFGNLAVHGFIPLIFLADYLLFNKRGHLKYRDVYFVLIYPIFYLTYSTILGLSKAVVFGTNSEGVNLYFPYFFIDINQYHFVVLVYVLVLVLIFIGISHLFYLYDQKNNKELANNG